jgi:general secretion pathway protein D
LSAKRTHTVISITLAQIALACALQTARAATPEASAAAPPARPTVQKPITREDADLMLREARGAIEQGRLDEADKILTRVENAHVNYSVFHVGPNPGSVRRELTRARRMAGTPGTTASQAANTGSKKFLPFARNGSTKATATQDPFAARNQMTDQKAAASTSPAAGSLSKATPDNGLGSISAPEVASASNPFSPAGRTAQLSSNDKANDPTDSLIGSRYPVTQANAQDNPFQAGAAAPAANAATSSAPPQDRYSTQSFASAPMPVGARTQPNAAPSAPGLIPPQNAASDRTANQSPSRAPSPKQQAQADLAAARKALAAGNIEQAEKLTRAATAAGVPESEYLPDEDRPSLVAWDIARAKQMNPSQKNAASPSSIERLPATASAPARYETPNRYDVQPAATANTALAPSAQLADTQPAAYRPADNSAKQSAPALALPPAANRVTSLPSAETPALQPAGDGPRMMAAAPGANPAGSQLRIASATAPRSDNLPPPSDAAAVPPLTDPAEPPSVDATPVAPAAPPVQAKASLIDSADENQQALARQLSVEIGKRQTEAIKLQEKDPERAVTILQEAQKLVKDSKLPESTQRELLSRIEITLARSEKYVNDNRSEIDLDKQNEAVLAERDREREMKLKMQQKMAELVDEFNRLRDEQRYAEMEIIARRLIELAPDEPVAQQVWLNAKFIRRTMINHQLADDKERSTWDQFNSVEQSAVNPVAADGQELAMDKKYWDDFVKNRKPSKDRIQRRTERELEIERRMKTPVLLRYEETPLSEVMSGLSELTGVNIHLDPRGLTQEGVNSDSPVTINLAKEISLKSALNLILEPLHLSYVVHDEVLKITSEQLRDGEIYPIPYNVADLVTPIPNFVPSSNIGLQGLINEAQASASQGRLGAGSNGPTVLVNNRGQKDTAPGSDVLAQQFNAAPNSGVSPSTVPIGAGPGGMGAGANADFDSLIDLIVSTVSTDTWAENGGGEAEIRPFPTNLSLVISQTQAVHEEIADLLQQLRRLQDLQVTIEVRFIRLNDSFFERIGIDFDLDVNDSGVTAANRGQFQPDNPEGNSNTVGLLQPAGTNVFPNFTTDLDIPFRQDSFNLTQVVPFGGPVGGGLNFGFAILSDLEAYFLIEAAQGDRRTNVLNAPKVTLFNGQQAFVADATQRPFVVGVIPVVGEFAAAQQPVIVVLNEGTMMTIQAVVSDDRRYVRMTIVPFFTQIGDVDEFTFEGSSSTTSSSASADDDDDGKNESKEEAKAESRSGVTVQLPSFSFVSVVTTVSVPDGGTVLLGGIKRLSEGRNEFGVPLLSKVPYINRLFRNVSIGRETDSLMMMVTPRIIIQEEEEERLGIAVP